MKPHPSRTFHTILAVGTSTFVALALAGCDVRREGGESAPGTQDAAAAGTPSPASSASPAAEGEEPVNSIIRDDIEEAPALVDLPPDPVDVTIGFPDGGTAIGEQDERRLQMVLESDAMAEGWPIVVGGHTDSGGNDRANLRASRARAEAVAAWLVERGVDDDRVQVIAFGEQNPVAPNALPNGEPDEAGRARNRRVQITIAEPVPAPRSSAVPSTESPSQR